MKNKICSFVLLVGPAITLMLILGIFVAAIHIYKSFSVELNENYYNKQFCKRYIGDTETSYKYKHGTIFVDCETKTHVWEGGLDKRSSLDSVQQALFFSELTGKKPAVVIYDRDNKEGSYEYRIRTVCERLGILYVNSKVN